ncbi:MAG: DUF4367 domain-containing protein [Chloroflexi bacterium]|nr:MAG: DUF4367 domain-containing protein [Chloroflexota bacterium]
MNEGLFRKALIELEKQRIPASLDLWTRLEAEINARKQRNIRLRRARRIAFGSSLAVLVLAALLLTISPGFRSAAAQAVREIGQFVGIAGNAKGPHTFTPPPPFPVKLPEYLPEGFRYDSVLYNPGENQSGDGYLPSIREVQIIPGEQAVGPAVQPTVAREIETRPSIWIRYKKAASTFFELYQRQAEPEEALPGGEELRIRGNAARLTRQGDRLTITWIEEETWIELSGTLPESELIQVAEGLRTAQTPDLELLATQVDQVEEPHYCDPSQIAPIHQPLLGTVRGQKKIGSVWIHMFAPGQYPVPESVAARPSVLEPALEALKNPEIPMLQLPYPNIGMFEHSEEDGCVKPIEVQGYIVIEVWEGQVNLGYGGEGEALRDRAIEVLERELGK